MLEAFARRANDTGIPRDPPPGVLPADQTALPPALRRFGAATSTAPHLAYPPNGSTVDLLPARKGFAPVILQAEGGEGALRWIINGVPQPQDGRSFAYRPDGPGFVRVELLDAHDQEGHAVFRIE